MELDIAWDLPDVRNASPELALTVPGSEASPIQLVASRHLKKRSISREVGHLFWPLGRCRQVRRIALF